MQATAAQLGDIVRSTAFDSVEDLMGSALQGGSIVALVEFALAMRQCRSVRHSMEDLTRDWPNRTKKWWAASFGRSLWHLYKVMMTLAAPKQARALASDKSIGQITKRQRRQLAGSGHVVARLPTVQVRVERSIAAIEDALRGYNATIWLDDFARRKYSKNPWAFATSA